MTAEADRLARRLWATARDEEQSALIVGDAALAAEVRERVRRLAAEDRIGVRTARVGESVVVVRLDARVWHEDTATMRRKLTPPATD